MSIHRRQLRLYVSPDRGPLSEILLDLDAVDLALSKLPAAQASEARAIREMGTQIRAKFADVVIDDQRARNQLGLLRRGWLSIQGLYGIVVRLTGEIGGDNAGEHLRILGEKLEREKRARESAEVQLQGVQAEQRRLKWRAEQAERELTELRRLKDLADAAVEQERQRVRHVREEVDQMAQEFGQARLRMEQMQREMQGRAVSAPSGKELADLREQVRSARAAEEQLRETLTHREQTIGMLQEQIRRLTEDDPASETGAADLYEL